MHRFLIAVMLFCISLLYIVSIRSAQAETTVFTQPTNILVWFVEKDANGNPLDNNPGLPGVQFIPRTDVSPNPKAVPFESDYLPNVVYKEISGSNASARKAQAVAARTYALWFVNTPPNYCTQGDPCHVTNSTSHQDYDPGLATNLEVSAVNETSGFYLVYSPLAAYNPIFAEFGRDHRNSDYTVPSEDNYPYTRSVYDPITRGDDDTRPMGNGVGLSQLGATKWGRGTNTAGEVFPKWDYTKILAHYYTGVQMRNSAGTPQWAGIYRWNLLRYSSTDPVYYMGEPRNISLTIQNTGLVPWDAGTGIYYRWKRTLNGSNGTAASYGSWQQATSGGAPATVPLLNPGDSGLKSVSATINIPASSYDVYNYSYQIEWDLRQPNGTFFGLSGYWLTQEWPITPKRRPPAPQPVTPPCTSICPQRQDIVSLGWNAVNHPDPVKYVWTHNKPNGTSLSGATASTQVQILLERGQNSIYVRSVDAADTSNSSASTFLTNAFYDPDPPVFTSFNTLPQWTNQQTLLLSWDAIDSLSGIEDYVVEQQINGGIWTTLVATTQQTNYQIINLSNNTTYNFRITARDNAGNTAERIVSTTIDRDPPSSILILPTGLINKTWTLLGWNSTSDRAPVVGYTIDRWINGTWQFWRNIGAASSTFFEGQPGTTYSFRIRATDAAGNIEASHSSADITFTTGTDVSGLYKIQLPLLPKTLPTSGRPEDDPYPLPQSR